MTDFDLALADGAEQVRQNVKVALLFFEGEWFLDTRIGVPYHQEVFVKGTPLSRIESIFREQILSVPEMVKVSSFVMEAFPARKMRVDFRGENVYGPIELSEVV